VINASGIGDGDELISAVCPLETILEVRIRLTRILDLLQLTDAFEVETPMLSTAELTC
jgi:hypothetical protein